MSAILLMAVLAVVVILVLSYAAYERRRAVRVARLETRDKCVFSGHQYARAYFANNFGAWNTYLADASHYTPAPWGTADPKATGAGTPQADNPELFMDLDGDGAADVYIYIRDNIDEYPPAADDLTRDNDQNVIVGAMCISETMQPRQEVSPGVFTVDTDWLLMESLLSYNIAGGTYGSQAGAGSSGTGNLNN